MYCIYWCLNIVLVPLLVVVMCLCVYGVAENLAEEVLFEDSICNLECRAQEQFVEWESRVLAVLLLLDIKQHLHLHI